MPVPGHVKSVSGPVDVWTTFGKDTLFVPRFETI
jgi:hypothetical protein